MYYLTDEFPIVVVGNSTTELVLLVCKRAGQTREAVAGTWISVPISTCTSKLVLTLTLQVGKNLYKEVFIQNHDF